MTLPLILARERDPELRGAGPARGADAGAGRGRLRRDRADRRAGGGAAEALERVAAAKADLPALPEGQRAALELVADSVADRYA